MQVSRLGLLVRFVISGVLTVSLTTSVFAQRTRLSALERRSFEDVLDHDGRRTPGLNLRSSFSLNKQPDVDFTKVEIRPLLDLLTETADESERLHTALRDDSAGSRTLQNSLQDVSRLRNIATYAAQDLERGLSLELLFPGIRKLSTDWRLLSHQLGQSPRVSRKSLSIVARIDRLEREMEKIFRLSPQLDRRALVNEFAGLQFMLKNLLQELQYDSRGTDRANEIVYQVRKLGQQPRHIEDLVLDGDSYDRIVGQFNRFSAQWALTLRELRRIENRYIQRGVRNIVDADSRIHNLLWLEKSTNREHLQELANSLIRSVDDFFNRTPLKLVVHLKSVDSILDKADDFYGTVQHFKQSIDDEEDDATLLENYAYVEEYGTDFVGSFVQMPSSAAQAVLEEIESAIGSLRAELNISGTVASFHTQKLVTIAASLESLADHLEFDVTNWLERDQASYQADATKAMDKFVLRCRRMHRLLQSRPTLSELRAESTDLNSAWTGLYAYLIRCPSSDRAHMIDAAQDINSTLYELERPLQL